MKYTYKEIKAMFDERGYEMITTKDTVEQMLVTDKLEYICPKHRDEGILKIDYHHLKRGRGCFYCGREKTAEKRRISVDSLTDKCRKVVEEQGFEFVSVYRKVMPNNKTQLTIKYICPKHRQYGIQETHMNNFLYRVNKGCKYCNGKGIPKEMIFQQVKEKLPHIEIISEFKGVTKPIQYRCTTHNYESWSTCQNLLAGRACYYCGLEKLSKHQTLTQDEFVSRVKSVNPDVEILGVYQGKDVPIEVRCKRCGSKSITPIYNLYRRTSGCSVCNLYNGEGVINELLLKWNYRFERQYTFDDCIDKRKLPFDFYLVDFNICIEFDGIQHYIPKIIKKGMTQQDAEYTHLKTVEHDKIKNKYCKDNNIGLIRIPYWEYDNDNIEYYLFDNLVKHKAIDLIA